MDLSISLDIFKVQLWRISAYSIRSRSILFRVIVSWLFQTIIFCPWYLSNSTTIIFISPTSYYSLIITKYDGDPNRLFWKQIATIYSELYDFLCCFVSRFVLSNRRTSRHMLRCLYIYNFNLNLTHMICFSRRSTRKLSCRNNFQWWIVPQSQLLSWLLPYSMCSKKCGIINSWLSITSVRTFLHLSIIKSTKWSQSSATNSFHNANIVLSMYLQYLIPTFKPPVQSAPV